MPNYSLKILITIRLQNFNQTSASNLDQKSALISLQNSGSKSLPNIFKISTKQSTTRSSTSTSVTLRTPRSFELTSPVSYISQVSTTWVSEWQGQTKWSDLGSIKDTFTRSGGANTFLLVIKKVKNILLAKTKTHKTFYVSEEGLRRQKF